MLTKRIRCMIMLTVLPHTLVIGAENATGKNEQILSVDEFVRQAAAKDRVFEEILMDELFLEYQKTLALPARDLVLSVKGEHIVDITGDTAEKEGAVSLSKLFPSIGAQISAEYTTSPSSSRPENSSEFTAEISQEIAKNAFGAITRLKDNIIGMENDIARYQIAEAYEDYFAGLIGLYYRWYESFENVSTADASYRENLKLLQNIQERKKNKIAYAIDVNKIQLQVLAKEENLISRKNEYNGYLIRLKQSLRLGDSDTVTPRDPSGFKEMAIDFEQQYQTFTADSRTYRMLTLLEHKSRLNVSAYKNNLLPSTKLYAGYGISGYDYEITEREKELYAGVTMELPLPGKKEHAGYRVSAIENTKTQLTADNAKIRIHSDLRILFEDIAREKELIEIADKKLALADAVLKDETENYSYGRATLNDLILEVNRKEDIRFSRILHGIQYKLLLIEWLRLTDRLVTK